jgi:UDP-N-acetylglucosamine/UDP-N-acetylgalactosamine diphosphorylase
MTSPATHDETVAYFQEHDYLGLDADQVRFFCQGMLPAVDPQTGRILLSEKGSVALSPDGHGGMLSALVASGCLDQASQRGLEVLFYGQVDNPLLQICDPEFLGFHLLARSDMTTQVIHKRFPLERVGNVVDLDGQTVIIEYSDLPNDVAEQRNDDGSLSLWAGNTAVHAFAVEFLVREAGDARGLPLHRASKKVPFVDPSGQLVEPTSPNAVKFERFIFDLLPRARRTIVVEVEAAAAFAPVKNDSSQEVDTPETARSMMIQRDASLLRAAGIRVSDGIAVEIHPLWAWDAQDVRDKLPPGLHITDPRFFV